MGKGMSAQIATSIDDYLRTSYPDVDREYRNGEVVERPMPDYLHGKVQALLCVFFALLRNRLPVFPSAETRLRMGESKVLIPGVTVFYPEEPSRQPDTPPFIAIEILSIDDKLSAVREKLEEYRAWGIPHVWLVDPHARRLYTCEPGLTEVNTLRIPELEIELKPADVFDWQ
jgi:Uma2 family endonuclease